MPDFYPRDIEKEAKRIAERVVKIFDYQEREQEISMISYELKGRVEHYLQLLYHSRNKNDKAFQ